MKILKLISLVSFLISFLNANEILLLHSYNKGLKWSDGISKGVEDVMKKYPRFELTTEYMDSKKIESEKYEEELLVLYQKKFHDRRYSAIIAADNYAYEFVLKYHATLFSNTPIIFCGVENFNPHTIPLHVKPFVTGVVEYKDIRKNLELMYSLFPGLKMVYIVSDDAYSSLAIKDQIIEESNYFKDKFRVVFDNKIDFDTIDEKIKALPKNSAILFTSFYRDMYGIYVPYHKLSAFFKRSKYPVFALNEIHLGEGVVGGYMINPYEQGMIAAQKAFEIIDGKKPSHLKVETPEGKYAFDYPLMRQFNVTLNDIPTTATLINAPESFFEKNRQLVENVFTFVPLHALLTLILLLNIFKRISLEKELLRQNNLDSVLLNNIQSAIFWKSNKGIILGCNDMFATLVGKNRHEIIGNDIKKIIPHLCHLLHFIPLDHPISEEVDMFLPSGQKATFAARRTAYTNEKDKEAGVVTILTDITEKKRIDTERKRHEQFVIQRSKQSEVGEMLASIAHQWKTPLVEISAIAQELTYTQRKRTLTELDTQKCVDDIMTQVRYMSNTIDDFRAFIKPSNEKLSFDIKESIEELLHIVDHSIAYNYITIHLEKSVSDAYFIAYGYPNEFKQCILNMINNAKDSILKKRQSSETKGIITLSFSNENEYIVLHLTDDGCGIEESKLENIFEPFMSTKPRGDGFGLYMARLIIEDKMGGKIMAHPKSDGAHFSIHIPAHKERYENLSA